MLTFQAYLESMVSIARLEEFLSKQAKAYLQLFIACLEVKYHWSPYLSSILLTFLLGAFDSIIANASLNALLLRFTTGAYTHPTCAYHCSLSAYLATTSEDFPTALVR